MWAKKADMKVYEKKSSGKNNLMKKWETNYGRKKGSQTAGSNPSEELEF